MNTTSSQKQGNLLGIYITSTSRDALLRKIAVDIKNKNRFYIVTPNPEIVMAAQKDTLLTTALNASEVAIADGIGLSMAHKFLSMKAPTNLVTRTTTLLVEGLIVGGAAIFNRKWLEDSLPIIKGRELFIDIVKLANKNHWKVYFLGGEDGEAEGAKKELLKNYRSLKIMTNAGPMLDISGTPITSTDELIENKVIDEINIFSPDFLFVGISHPRQEKWLYRHYKKLNIKGAMTVGGTFKYYSGKVQLPPKFMDNIGLSWLWRLLTGDQKLSRIYTAVIKFPLKVFTTKLLQK